MEEVSLQIEKLTGQASDNNAPGVYSARVSFHDGSIGTLVGCILVKGNGEVRVSPLVREIFDIANKKLEAAETGSLNVLRSCAAASVDFVSSKNLEASFCFVMFYKNASYIFRSGDQVKVWAFLNSTSQELTFEHGSGHLNLGQIILLATVKFLASFDIGDALREKNVDLDELVDGLATEISAKEDQSEIAAAIVLVKEAVGKEAAAGELSDSDTAVVEEEEPLENVRPVGEEADVVEPQLDVAHEIAAHAVVSGESPSLTSEPSAVVTSDEVADQATIKPLSEFAANTQAPGPDAQSKFKNPLFFIARAITREASKLKRGDTFAIFRLRRNVVIAAVVFLLVLAGSVGFALRNSANSEKQSEFESYLSAASSKYEEGLAIISLNQEKARTLLIDADNEVKKALAVKSDDKKAIDLQSQIAAKLKETENLSSVQFSTFVEVDGNLVALLKSSENLIGVVGGNIYVIDGDGTISSEVGGKSGAIDGAFYDNKVFAFDGSSITRVDLGDGASEKIVDVSDVKDINVFLGNVYVLGNNQIFKYVPIEAGFAESVNYLNQSEEFSTSSRFVIDGSVWVTKGDKVFEYLRGEKQEFNISGLVGSLGELGEIYTDSEIDNIYVIDKVNSSLLVVDKEGIYKKSYQSQEFKNATDLVVNEGAGKFYISIGKKVLEGPL